MCVHVRFCVARACECGMGVSMSSVFAPNPGLKLATSVACVTAYSRRPRLDHLSLAWLILLGDGPDALHQAIDRVDPFLDLVDLRDHAVDVALDELVCDLGALVQQCEDVRVEADLVLGLLHVALQLLAEHISVGPRPIGLHLFRQSNVRALSR